MSFVTPSPWLLGDAVTVGQHRFLRAFSSMGCMFPLWMGIQLQLAPLSYSELLYMSDRHTCSLCPLIPEQPPLLVSGSAYTIDGSRGLRANRQWLIGMSPSAIADCTGYSGSAWVPTTSRFRWAAICGSLGPCVSATCVTQAHSVMKGISCWSALLLVIWEVSMPHWLQRAQALWPNLYGQMISPLLASTSLLALIDLRSTDLFRPDIHMPINLGGCAHE